ncbi:hypothetical protein PPL_07427 [Heterostelium album PN500]|uniref:Ankyrin repeat-containing protein n=1 Tax=Heterostelium pallidum (strain ATCC 26659 / Pp 5 / PN500) TaxID=670386 RepID=D3BFX6_HETP5|nr:hypothetical protein PPL_07427 [Heterostelium album PN500]EFA79736.1 hypothetical protein PPL_07427 [Heterostelium album PN500]|eukprot:XP_020431857.1 hypothetical protein PPL_07427 [Heterostelium album PN500]
MNGQANPSNNNHIQNNNVNDIEELMFEQQQQQLQEDGVLQQQQQVDIIDVEVDIDNIDEMTIAAATTTTTTSTTATPKSTTPPIGTPALPIVASSLVEQCFEVIMANLDYYQSSDLSNVLPVPIKDKMFAYYTSKISNEPSTSPFPITSYPEDRYRDVQLVNRITCQRVIPLCFAMWSSLDYRYEKVRKLIEEEACDVNESDLEGFCPLHYAAIYGRIDACKLLLMHGADCSRKNNFGKTPADLAQDVKVQQMIKLRAILFRKEEVKEMEQDLIVKRKKIEEYKKKKLIEDFLSNSKQFSSVLEQKGYNMKKKQSVQSQTQQQQQQQQQHLQQNSTSTISNNSNNNNNNNNNNDISQSNNNNNGLNLGNNNNNMILDSNIIDSTVNNNNLSITSPTPSIVIDESNAADNTLRTFIAQVDLPTTQQLSGVSIPHHHHQPNSYSQVTHSLSNMAISIPRTRQSNSTGPIPHHTIGLDSLLVNPQEQQQVINAQQQHQQLKSDNFNNNTITFTSSVVTTTATTSSSGEDISSSASSTTSTTATSTLSIANVDNNSISSNSSSNSNNNNSNAEVIRSNNSNAECCEVDNPVLMSLDNNKSCLLDNNN